MEQMESETNHVCKPSYVCEGDCGANLTEEEYAAHETKVCGAENCPNKGQVFVRKDCPQESH